MGKRQQQKRKSSSNVRRTRTVKVKGEAPGVMVQQKKEEEQQQQQQQRRRPKISSSSTSLPLLPPRPPTTRTTASPSKSDTHEQEVEQEQGSTSGRRQSPSPPPRFFATDDHPCQTTSQQSAVESIEHSSPQSNMAYPPPPPEIDPAATGGYGAYATNGTTDPYGAVDEHGNQVQHLPPLSEALHTDDINNPGNPANHLNVHGAHYGSHASANAYDPQQQADPSSGAGANQHGQYDQQSSNFFDTQHMEPPPPADGTGHHATHNTATINSQNHANGYGAAIMTPPPPASSQGYPSSPYQSAGASAPLFHRASISGPVMHNHYAAPTGAPSTANHSADVWSSTPAAARPHTADGMFASHMGGLPGQWASISDYNRGPRGSIGSMSDAAPSGGGKVFSYMPSNGDDSSSTAGSQSHHTSGGPRKRPRRRYDEIERLYTCSWPGCQKSYGTLNHLNAHVAMQKHGPKRSPGEFKEMRKAWRKGKREEEQRRQASAAAANEDALSRSKMMFATPNQPFMTHAGYGMNNFGGQSAHQMPPPAPAPASGSHFPGAHNGRSGAYGYPTGMDTSRSYGGGQGGAAGSGGLGAYLMAHRGSI